MTTRTGLSKLTDWTGTILERYEYDAYGNSYVLEPNFAPDSDGQSNYGNPYLFTGRRVDILDSGSLKLQYNRNRYYDYYSGRWLTHDPLDYVDGVNLYEYASSNPVISVDPVGSFYIGVHTKVSKKAYSESGLTFRTRKPPMLGIWIRWNWTTDFHHFFSKAYHCTAASFVSKVETLKGKIKAEKCPYANPQCIGVSLILLYMGRMSHILQDCMAHTDWVEGNNEDMRKWYKRVETEKVMKCSSIMGSAVCSMEYKYSKSIRNKAAEFYLQSAGKTPHSTGLDLTQLSSDASNLFYFSGTGIPTFESLHNLFATDGGGHGRDKEVPNAFVKAKKVAVAQTVHILNWSHDNMRLCCRCAIFGFDLPPP